MVSKSPTANRLTADQRATKTTRRINVDRRQDEASAEPVEGVEQRQTARRKIERRRKIDPTTCERDYSDQEIEFMRAMDEYKRKSGRQFPTWSEVLEVLRYLGYRQVEKPKELIVKTS